MTSRQLWDFPTMGPIVRFPQIVITFNPGLAPLIVFMENTQPWQTLEMPKSASEAKLGPSVSHKPNTSGSPKERQVFQEPGLAGGTEKTPELFHTVLCRIWNSRGGSEVSSEGWRGFR